MVNLNRCEEYYPVDTPFKERTLKKFLTWFDNNLRERKNRVGNGSIKSFTIILLDFPKWSVYYDYCGVSQETHSFHFTAPERKFLWKWLEKY